MKKLWLALAAMAVLMACKREIPEGMSTLPDRFTASIEQEDDTRTYVDGEGDNVRMHWTAGDEIAVFNSTYGEEYRFTGNTGATGGDFEKVNSGNPRFTTGFELDRNYAVYPYAEGLQISEDGKVTVTLPATQPYAQDSFGLGTGLMTAVTANTQDTHLTFKNVTGYLKLKVYGGAAVKSVTFQGNKNEKLTGTAVITIPAEGVPTIAVTGDGEIVTLDCGAGVATSEDPAAPTTFWFALPPMTFEQGFTVTVTDVNDLVTTKATSQSIEIKRNIIKPMAAFQIDGQTPEPPAPEIPDLPGWPYTGSKLPCLFVYTPDNVAITSKEEWVSGSHAYLRLPDETVTDLGTANIRWRGNTTLHYLKKAYALKLDKKPANDILGMPADKRWDLLANYVDRTRIRNHVAFEIGRRLSGLDWTPKGEFVELFLNGEHMGNYYLVEHIKVNKKRVNITEMKAGDTDLSGGYLLEMGIEMDEPYQFYTNPFPDPYFTSDGLHTGSTYKLPVMVKSPEDENMDANKLQWIQNFINNDVQAKIIAQDPSWHDVVDMDSFVDWMLVEELTGNYEPFHPKSSFMHKDRGGKLKMGPIWDFDYGTFTGEGRTPVYHYSIWYDAMRQDYDFRAKVRERWPAVKAAAQEVANSLPSGQDNSWMNLMVSIDKDFSRWRNADTQHQSNYNGDQNMGIWVAVKRVKDNLNARIKQFDEIEIPNAFKEYLDED